MGPLDDNQPNSDIAVHLLREFRTLGVYVRPLRRNSQVPRPDIQISGEGRFLGNHASTSTLTFLQELHATKASGKLLIGAFIVNALIW